jgi:hypothetical protein
MLQFVMSLLFAATVTDAPLSYTAEVVSVRNGETVKSTVWSDGVRRKTETVSAKGERSGALSDESKNLQWLWGVGFSCLQMPRPETKISTPKEELIGSESVDGHPAKKYKVTRSYDDGKQKIVSTTYEWRATDLHNLVVQWVTVDGSTRMNLRNIRVGAVDAKSFAMPPDCKYDEMTDEARNAPAPAGGYRTVRFSDASCKQMIPLPITMSIPSDFAIRKGGHLGCFWGAENDLRRALAEPEHVDFTSNKRGMFWCRISDSTEYNPGAHVFVNEMGPDSAWAASMAANSGAKNVTVKRTTIGKVPALIVTASVGGQRVYMLYMGVLDSPAILINYKPGGEGHAIDDTVWSSFVDSLRAEK